jgi:hypothetical protein
MSESQVTKTAKQFHPIADMFPLMTETEFAGLRSDIEANGQREAIWLHDDKIIDGRNRYNACQDLGIEPKFQEWSGSGSVVAFVVSLNLNRRHLNESQRAMVAQKITNMQRGDNQFSVGEDTQICGSITQNHAAQLLNVSPRSISSAERIVRDGVPELIEKVEAGEISVSAASDLSKLPKYRQKRLIKAGRSKTKKLLSKIREKSLVNATRGGKVCVVCSAGVADTDENFLAAIQLVGQQFPAHQRFLMDAIEELAQTELSEETVSNYDRIIAAIRTGQAEHTDCRKASGVESNKFDATISQMLDHGMIEVLMQGGKTDEARGARKKIYAIVERSESDWKDPVVEGFYDGW